LENFSILGCLLWEIMVLEYGPPVKYRTKSRFHRFISSAAETLPVVARGRHRNQLRLRRVLHTCIVSSHFT